MYPEGQHWIERLMVDPAFAQYEASQAAEFDRMIGSLLADNASSNPIEVAKLIGELRGFRRAQQVPSRIARLAREANQ